MKLKLAISSLAVTLWAACCFGQEKNSPPQGQIPPPPECMVVLLYDDHCKTFCEKVRPILSEVKDRYGDKILYVELNTAAGTLKDSKQKAKELGVLSFLADYGDFVPYVGIFNKKRRLIKELQGAKEKDAYLKAIEKALSEN